MDILLGLDQWSLYCGLGLILRQFSNWIHFFWATGNVAGCILYLLINCVQFVFKMKKKSMKTLRELKQKKKWTYKKPKRGNSPVNSVVMLKISLN